jgi:hypothetical protein
MKGVVLSMLWELSSFCLVLILLAVVKNYVLNAFAISWQLLIEFPSIFKVLIFSVLPVLLVFKFTTFQIVLFLFNDLLILSA